MSDPVVTTTHGPVRGTNEGGVNVFKGKITCRPVAEAFGAEFVKLEALLESGGRA